MGRRARREGVAAETGVEVGLESTDPPRLSFETDDSEDRPPREFDAVVVAAGARTAGLLGAAGIDVPVVPYRVQALTSRVAYDGPMVYDATAGVYYRPHPTGLLAGDGTEPVAADPDEYDREGDDWFVASVSDVLRKRATHDPDVTRAWAGLCTATPDGDPLVGPVAGGAVASETDRLFVAAGWQGHGFMRAPAMGEHVAEGVLASLSDGSEPPSETPWIDAFDPDRFDGDEEFEIREGMAVRRRTE